MIRPLVSPCVRRSVATLLLAALPLAARAVEVPASAATPDTKMVAWVDLTAPEAKATATGLMDFLSSGFWMGGLNGGDDPAKAKAMVKAMETFHDGFSATGGQGLLLSVTEAPDKPDVTHLLIKVKPGTDRVKLEKVFRALVKEAGAAVAGGHGDTLPEDIKVEAYGQNTEWLALTHKTWPMTPLTGAGKEAAAFNAAFKADAKAPLQFCLRMTPRMKAEARIAADKARNENQANLPAPLGMMMTTLGNAKQALPDLDTVVVFGHGTKGDRQLAGTAHFSNAGSAVGFSGASNALVQAYKEMMGQAVVQMGRFGVDAKTANAVFDGLSTQCTEQDVTLKLNEQFIANLAVFATQMRDAQRRQMEEFRNQNPGFGGQEAPVVDVDGDE